MAFGEKSEGKMGNASLLSLLNELEKMIDYHLQDFQVSDQIDGEKVQDEWQKIKKK